MASSWEIVQHIPVDLRRINIKSALTIAIEFNIYAYDAYFLECADNLRSPLLTLDRGMKRIAKSPFDVPGIKTKATTNDILDAVKESRERFAEQAATLRQKMSTPNNKNR